MPSSPIFEKLYTRLNPAQKKAVDTIDGPVMVIAGPGTGKTQVLTLRIANILQQTDTDASNILALTFTESGVHSMRRRLVHIMGSDAYRLGIFTFHGFCNDVIHNHPDSFPRIVGARHMTEVDQLMLLEEIVSETKFKLLKPYGDTFYYVKPVLSTIRNLKRERVGVGDFQKLVQQEKKAFEKTDDRFYTSGRYEGKLKGVYRAQEKSIAKNTELLKIYTRYEELLKEQRLYDYEDMIIETVQVLEQNEDLLLELQERFHYILADEHQDANTAQNTLLELLASFHDTPNIFIVGDEKQAIFRFQGASLENFLYFKKRFPEAQLITLTDNYRSTQTILHGAHAVMTHSTQSFPQEIGSPETLRPRLQSHSGKGTPLQLYSFADSAAQYAWIPKHIHTLLQKGEAAGEIAVLYRDNKDALPIARELERAGIPFRIESSRNVLADEDIQKLITLFRAVAQVGNDVLLARLLYVPLWDIEHIDVYKLLTYANQERVNLYTCIKSRTHLKKAGVSDPNQFLAIYRKVSSWSGKAHNQGLVTVFETIMHESGFLHSLLHSQSSVEKLAKLDTLLTQAKERAGVHVDEKLVDFLDYIALLQTYDVGIGIAGGYRHSDEEDDESEYVRLMTVHRAKGLEFDHVIIADVHDTHWGNRRHIAHFHIPLEGLKALGIDRNEDERRLLYVALTRARKSVVLTYARTGENGKEQLPSQFVEEIDRSHITTTQVKADTTQLTAPPTDTPKGISVTDRTYLRQRFLEQGLSVTALNNYLSCPWKYFFMNLVRIPSAPNKHQSYGTAVHAALRIFFEGYRKKRRVGKKTLLKYFEDALSKAPLSEADFKESLAKGVHALSGWYDTYKGSWERAIKNELDIAGVFVDVEHGEKIEHILLKGILDKVVFGKEGTLSVVDYKTGKPRSRGYIEGSIKSSNGDYWRQLVFYRLLLERLPNPEAILKGAVLDDMRGVIDFIESDEKGNYHKEEFIVTHEDVNALEKTIANVAQEILLLSFWDRECENKQCGFCRMRRMMT